MGLFDFNYEDPQQVGQNAFAAALLNAAGPSKMPISTGQALAQGLMLRQQQAAEAMQNKRRNAFIDAQLQDILAQAQQRQLTVEQSKRNQELQQAFLGRLLGQPQAAAPAIPSVGPMSGATAAGPAGQMRLQNLAALEAQQRATPTQQQGAFPFNLNEVVAAKVLGLPDMTEPYKFANTPQERKQGSTYVNPVTGNDQFVPEIKISNTGEASVVQRNPDGTFTLSPPKGALETAGMYQTQSERIKSQFTPFSYKSPDTGQPRVTSVAGALGAQQEGISPGELKDYGALLMKSRNPQTPMTHQETAKMADIERRFGGSAQGGFATGPDVATEQNWKNIADLNQVFTTKTLPAANEAAATAKGMLGNIQIARYALKKSGSGWGTEELGAFSNILAASGVAPEAVKDKATAVQLFQQVASTRLWEVLNAAKGPQTEGDANRAKATFARLGSTPEANNFILDVMQANAERDNIKAQFYAKAIPVATSRREPLTQIESEWLKRMPSVFDMPSMQKWAK